MARRNHVALISLMEFSQDINVLADLCPLEGPVQFRHSLRSKDDVTVGAEGAFWRKRGFTGGTVRGVVSPFVQPTTQGLSEAHHGLFDRDLPCPLAMGHL